MGFLSVLSFAHELVRQRVQPGEPVIDATAGNGNDTLLLAQCTGPTGTVYAFDIQELALQNTANRCEQAGVPMDNLRLIKQSHADMAQAVSPEHHGKIAAIMFNFGYLPGGDKQIITETDSSIAALEASLKLLRPDGVITAVLYPGHAGGDEEAAVIDQWAKNLPRHEYPAIVYKSANASSSAPYLIAIEKRS